MASVVIVGGGISGLSAAYYLARNACSSSLKRITLLEGSSHLGGWMQTSRQQDGALFEKGPRSIRGYGESGHNTLELVEELGLEDSILPIGRDHPATKNRFLYVDGKLQPLPNNMFGVIRKRPPFSRSLLYYIMKEPYRPPAMVADETIHQFFTRRLGEEVATYGVDPLCRGVFAGSTRQLSIRSCFPDVHKYERKYGSIIRGMIQTPKAKPKTVNSKVVEKFLQEKWQLWSLKDGLQQMVDQMVHRLEQMENVEIHKETMCTALDFTDGHAKVMTSSDEINADYVIGSCYSQDLAALLPSTHSALSNLLGNIPAVTVAVVNLQYMGDVLPVTGFGHLIPSTEDSKVMGVIYDSCIFPEHDRSQGSTTRLTCMMGGAWFNELFGDEDEVNMSYLTSVAIDSVREQLNIQQEPINAIATLHKACIPQYLVGHSQLLDQMEKYIDKNKLPLGLVGSSYRGVSVNDCIANSRKEADKVLQRLSEKD